MEHQPQIHVHHLITFRQIPRGCHSVAARLVKKDDLHHGAKSWESVTLLQSTDHAWHDAWDLTCV
jgi:hypothetical protein